MAHSFVCAPPDARVWHLPKSGRQTGGADAIRSEASGDIIECAAKLRTDRGDGGDDDDGDQSGDETIFDGRDAGLIVDKATEQITHD